MMRRHLPVTEPISPSFHPIRLVLVVLVVLLLVFRASGWYAGQVSVPRYCEQQELMLQHLTLINTQDRPAGDSSRRNFIVAAKLEFLLPRMADEPVDAYIRRLRTQLEQQCR
jgi:hypothetical protein